MYTVLLLDLLDLPFGHRMSCHIKWTFKCHSQHVIRRLSRAPKCRHSLVCSLTFVGALFGQTCWTCLNPPVCVADWSPPVDRRARTQACPSRAVVSNSFLFSPRTEQAPQFRGVYRPCTHLPLAALSCTRALLPAATIAAAAAASACVADEQ